MRWIALLLLLFAAHINLTALVPAKAGQAPPPWWVGGRLVWPFGLDTQTLIPAGGALDTLTPILGIASAVFFLLAAGALLHWVVPGPWLGALIVAGAACSLVLQVVWISPWAVLPLIVDGVLLWALLGARVSVLSVSA
jgi:hypothetical protein